MCQTAIYKRYVLFLFQETKKSEREKDSSWLCISNGLKKKKAIPSIYKIGLQFCRILLGPGGDFENTFMLFPPDQSRLLSLLPPQPTWEGPPMPLTH